MNDETRAIPLLELADFIGRRAWVLVAGLCLGAAAGLVALEYLPKVYEATTKFLVSPQQIPESFVPSTVSEDLASRMAALHEAVLSRRYLEKVIEDVYGGEAKSGEGQERLMELIRANFRVRMSSMNLSRRNASVYFELIYRDSDPERAAKVVNTLAELYIRENSQFRTRMAKETTKTLETLAARVEQELREKEKQLAEFKRKHIYDNASQLETNLRLLEARQRDLETNRAELDAARERLAALQKQSNAGARAVEEDDPLAARVRVLERELEELRSKYSEFHPSVKAKRRELEEALEALPSASAAEQRGSARLAETAIAAKIEEQQREVARLERENERIRREIREYRSRIEATPHTEQQLAELMKGYDVLRQQFRDYHEKIQAAKSSVLVEESSKGERFEIIERAVPPSLPIRPKPLIVFPVALLAGLALFVGPPVVRELWSPRVRSQAGVKSMPVALLASIPRIPTRAVRRQRVRLVLMNIVLSLISLGALAGAAVWAR